MVLPDEIPGGMGELGSVTLHSGVWYFLKNLAVGVRGREMNHMESSHDRNPRLMVWLEQREPRILETHRPSSPADVRAIIAQVIPQRPSPPRVRDSYFRQLSWPTLFRTSKLLQKGV